MQLCPIFETQITNKKINRNNSNNKNNKKSLCLWDRKMECIFFLIKFDFFSFIFFVSSFFSFVCVNCSSVCQKLIGLLVLVTRIWQMIVSLHLYIVCRHIIDTNASWHMTLARRVSQFIRWIFKFFFIILFIYIWWLRWTRSVLLLSETLVSVNGAFQWTFPLKKCFREIQSELCFYLSIVIFLKKRCRKNIISSFNCTQWSTHITRMDDRLFSGSQTPRLQRRDSITADILHRTIWYWRFNKPSRYACSFL